MGYIVHMCINFRKLIKISLHVNKLLCNLLRIVDLDHYLGDNL